MSGMHNCYEVALELALAQKWTLVHGVPTGRLAIEGMRFGHAWCEHDGMVVDRSNGQEVCVPRALYYRLGNIDPAECRYYTPAQAYRYGADTGHSGPWHPDDADVAYAPADGA